MTRPDSNHEQYIMSVIFATTIAAANTMLALAYDVVPYQTGFVAVVIVAAAANDYVETDRIRMLLLGAFCVFAAGIAVPFTADIITLELAAPRAYHYVLVAAGMTGVIWVCVEAMTSVSTETTTPETSSAAA